MIFIFLAVLLLILSSLFIPEFRKRDLTKENSQTDNKQKHVVLSPTTGIKFQSIGGFGTITCNQCSFSENITSFTHGPGFCSTGFQCQSCGKFNSRLSVNPYYDPDEINIPLSELFPNDNKPIATPDQESISYRESLKRRSKVRLAELKNIKKNIQDMVDADNASPNCECGGILGRDNVLFCPQCRSTDLSYKLKVLT